MRKLDIRLRNCFGINSLEHVFDFETTIQNPLKQRAYAIYAPNGLMKSSFAKTFDELSRGNEPREERYGRLATCVVLSDGVPLSREAIFVLKSELDIGSDSPSITNILVNPEHKARYDALLVDLEKQRNSLIVALQRKSKVRKADVEQTILKDCGKTDLPTCIHECLSISIQDNLKPYVYATIFDPKTIEVISSQNFIDKANEFNSRYQELFECAGTIYKKGIFNPARANTSFGTLSKHGFFEGGHKVHIEGESASFNKDELDQRLQALHENIDADQTLINIREALAKNAQTQALIDLIESLASSDIEFLLEKLKPQNIDQFRNELWAYYVQNSIEANPYLSAYDENRNEIANIESLAAEAAPRWTDAVNLFNERFVDMPFALSVSNQSQAALGKENARLKFTFRDGDDSVDWSRSEIKTLSQGEKRALYLLNFIFDVEARKIANQETLFVLDDVADSFDYKNKHAIIQYLSDLCEIEYFHQIILTHNFDFFRSLNNSSVVPYDRCLMANKAADSISLENAQGIKNYFIRVWKDKVTTDNRILCATIPFTRNLIEYTKGNQDDDYVKLTSLLHWKMDTNQITVGDYLQIYNNLFQTSHDINDSTPIYELIFQTASAICDQPTHEGLNLENKVLLSIAIRLKAEILITSRIRVLRNDVNYWCPASNQFGKLMKEFSWLNHDASEMRCLKRVSITVSSNIHLNSFMYEPILDLSIEHLIALYSDILAFETSTPTL